MNKRILLATTGPAAAGLALSVVTWAQIPDPMPISWDASGDPNGWAPRVVGLLMLPLVGLAAATLTRWAMRQGKTTERMAAMIALGIGGFHLGVHSLMLHAALHPAAAISMTGILVLVGALFGGLGLVMPHLKQNRWAGVRTPWTLGDEVNWKLTHRFAAWTMGLSGVACMVAAALLTPPMSFWIGMTAIIIGSLVPIGYSYAIHRMRRR